MPLYMDFHELNEFSDDTIEQLKQGHRLDLATQAKYHVTYKHYYISKENRKAFCVMEGPDKESCQAVHRESHGLVACNIVEVELNRYGLMMGTLNSDADGLYLHKDGTIDSGFRAILLISTVTSTLDNRSTEGELSGHLADYLNTLRDISLRYGGREVASGKNETTYAFTSCTDAVQCAIVIRERVSSFNVRLSEKKIRFETTIVLNGGDPVTYNETFFGDTLQLARRLSHSGKDGDIIISSCVSEWTHSSPEIISHQTTLKLTSFEDEQLISRIVGILENKIKDENLNVIELSEQVGISRPHLYRRIHDLFGRSPNHLIHEMRLKEAAKLIHKRFGNISEIAYEVGYNNPSYFAKCFQRRFGILPSLYHRKGPPSEISQTQ